MTINILKTESLLRTLGTVEDLSLLVMEQYKEKIIKVYDLLENKYNDVTDDSLTIEIHSDNTYVVTNEDLSYSCSSKSDTQKLEQLFHDSSFLLQVEIIKNMPYMATISVSAKVTRLDELQRVILEYRSLNDLFLSDKVKYIIGDNGLSYLDRI